MPYIILSLFTLIIKWFQIVTNIIFYADFTGFSPFWAIISMGRLPVPGRPPLDEPEPGMTKFAHSALPRKTPLSASTMNSFGNAAIY